MASKSEALDFYRAYGRNTDPGEYADLFEVLPESLQDLCAWVKRVLIHPAEVERYADRLPEGQTREDADFYAVHDMLQELINRNPQGLTVTRKPAEKLVLSCRFHAMLLASVMKSRGIPARVRVGFAGYLAPASGKHFDHWVTQIWNTREDRWMFVDPDAQRVDFDDFELAGDIWLDSTRAGSTVDPQQYGFHIWWGLGYIKGNLCHDLYACLNNALIYWDGPELFHRDAENLSVEERALVDRLANLLKHPEENLEMLMKLQAENPLLQNIRGTAPAL
jgi:hypothetical protein